MAETLNVENFSPINLLEKSEVDTDAAAGQKVVAAKNIQGYVKDDFLIVGRRGSEQAEIKKVASVSSQNISVVADFDFAHKRFEDLIKLRGDKIVIYRAANVDGSIPADSDFASIATLTIEADQLFTTHEDSTGGEDFWYKSTYKNSVTSDETDKADAVAIRGGDFGHYATTSQIRTEAGFEDDSDLADSFIAERRDNAESVVKGTLASAGFTLPLATPVPGIVENVTKILAAAYILLSDYGVGADGTNKEGNAKLKIANDMLKQIQQRRVELLNIQGSAIDQTSQIRGWPDNSTKDADDDEAGGDVKFRMNKKF